MKRIYLLDPRCMLGEMVRRYFVSCEGFEVVAVDQRFDHDNLVDYFRRYDSEPPAVFINGIGVIPQKAASAQDFVLPILGKTSR
jgi:anti-sigma regulatory factor (Ser/Thr protein kinase)